MDYDFLAVPQCRTRSQPHNVGEAVDPLNVDYDFLAVPQSHTCVGSVEHGINHITLGMGAIG